MIATPVTIPAMYHNCHTLRDSSSSAGRVVAQVGESFVMIAVVD